MATRTVTAPNFPPGTAVRAYPAETVELERRLNRTPIVSTWTDDGTIDASHQVSITGSAGKYLLLGVVFEVQSVKVDATAGQFKLTFSGQQTGDIEFDASATTGGASVRALLEALSNVAPGDVVVSGGPGDSGGTTPFVVTFEGVYAGVNVPALTAQAGTTPLSGGGSAVTITTTTSGADSPDAQGDLRWERFTI